MLTLSRDLHVRNGKTTPAMIDLAVKTPHAVPALVSATVPRSEVAMVPSGAPFTLRDICAVDYLVVDDVRRRARRGCGARRGRIQDDESARRRAMRE